MSRDPFDEMKRSNPVPGDQLPSAPMSMAENIIGRRARAPWPGWAVAAVAAVMVAVVGGGVLYWMGNDNRLGGVADGGSTTTVVDSTTPPTTTAPDIDLNTSIYYFGEIDAGLAGGPFLIPLAVTADGPDEVTAAMLSLLEGPRADAAAAGIHSAIPEGTTLNAATVEGGVAIVDLSSEFVSGGGSFSMQGRVAQVVYTLTELDGVGGVRFLVDGTPTTVFGGEGVIVDDPATRYGLSGLESSGGFADLLPAVFIESPGWGGEFASNQIAFGNANVFEATVSIELLDADGVVLFEGFTTATCGTGCRGAWEISIPYSVSENQFGTLRAFESSAMDGSPINVREHKVWLTTGDTSTTTTTMIDGGCSGSMASPTLVDQADLPTAVAETRQAVFEAALVCDWAALQSLVSPTGFSYSFGGGTDPIGQWQIDEAEGRRPMYYLAELLNRSSRADEYDKDLTYHYWPAVFGVEWSATTEQEREELKPLYDEEDFAFFSDFGGYIGYRVGILDNGSWVFFLAGD